METGVRILRNVGRAALWVVEHALLGEPLRLPEEYHLIDFYLM